MTSIDFLNRLKTSLPIQFNDSEKSFKEDLDLYFEDIQEMLNDVDNAELIAIANSFGWNREQLIKNFWYLTESIIRTVHLMYDGKPAQAYNFFKNKVLSVRFDGDDKRYIDSIPVYGIKGTSFYRLRKKEGNMVFGNDNLFHIPFELRTEVKPQRFSILGHPSLYLGASMFICWHEMGAPNISEMYASRYTINEGTALLDLSIPNEFVSLSEASERERAFHFILAYPLIAAISVLVKKPESPFKPEYIIPQLLMQFARNEKKIDGIMHSSTKLIDRNINEAWNFKNVVLPVLSNKDSGYCEKLRNKFIISEPKLCCEVLSDGLMFNAFADLEKKMFG